MDFANMISLMSSIVVLSNPASLLEKSICCQSERSEGSQLQDNQQIMRLYVGIGSPE
jgi:hypothetical protein